MELYKTDKDFELLFRKLGIRRITANEFLFKEKITFDPGSTPYFMDNFDEFSRLEKKYGNKLRDHYYAQCYIKKIDSTMGYGLFVSEPVAEGELIGEYTGIVKESPCPDLEDRVIAEETEYAWDYPEAIPGLRDLELNAGSAGSILRFINHSFTPNLRIEHAVIDNNWKIFFVADEDINKGSELYVDYGDAYWSSDFRTCVV